MYIFFNSLRFLVKSQISRNPASSIKFILKKILKNKKFTQNLYEFLIISSIISIIVQNQQIIYYLCFNRFKKIITKKKKKNKIFTLNPKIKLKAILIRPSPIKNYSPNQSNYSFDI